MHNMLPPNVQIIANKAEKAVNIAKRHKSAIAELTEETQAIAVMADVLRSITRACKAIEDALNHKIKVLSETETKLEMYRHMATWHKHLDEPAPDNVDIEIYNVISNDVRIGNSCVIGDAEYWRPLNFSKKVS